MFTAREIIAFAYQLKDDYGDRVKTGVFAQITTPSHEAYPKVFIFGFAMAARTADFTFPNAVQLNIEEMFDSADWVQTGRHQLVVITDDYALHEQIIEEFLTSGIQKWRNTDSLRST